MEKAGLSGIVMDFAGVGGEKLACLLASCLPFPSQSTAHTSWKPKKLQRARLERVHAADQLQYTAIGAVVPLLLQSFFPARIAFPPLPNPDM